MSTSKRVRHVVHLYSDPRNDRGALTRTWPEARCGRRVSGGDLFLTLESARNMTAAGGTVCKTCVLSWEKDGKKTHAGGHLVARKDGVLCTLCWTVVPVHPGNGTPLPSLLQAYAGVAVGHPFAPHAKP